MTRVWEVWGVYLVISLVYVYGALLFTVCCYGTAALMSNHSNPKFTNNLSNAFTLLNEKHLTDRLTANQVTWQQVTTGNKEPPKGAESFRRKGSPPCERLHHQSHITQPRT